MTYLETCKGNLENLFTRCNEIVKGLKAIFPLGDFSVLIEIQVLTIMFYTFPQLVFWIIMAIYY